MAHTYSYDEVLEASTEYFNNEDLPAKVFVDKYALRDNDGNLLEKTPADMHKRIAKEIARVEAKKYKNTDVEPLTADEVFGFLDHFKRIIPQGSPMHGIGNKNQYVTLSNCYVLTPPEDSYGGILYTDEELVQISKRRGGVGIDITKLRPNHAPTTNSARTSTGPVTFAERYSHSIREVGQAGRRGALMVTMNVHHPDVLELARAKVDRSRITGANVSILLTDEFLEAVKADREYEQRWPVDSKAPEVSKMVSAREVWQILIKYAHECAEPGLLFWDTIIAQSPSDCYSHLGFQTVSTNPCVPANALIHTSRGPRYVVDLIGSNFEAIVNGQQFPASRFFFTGIKDVYEITTSRGFKLRCTDNHQIKVASNITRYKVDTAFKSLSDISLGDSIVLSNHRGYEWEGSYSEAEGWLVGNLLGDGTFTDNCAKLQYWEEDKEVMHTYASDLIQNNLRCRADVGNKYVSTKTSSVKSVELKKLALKAGLNTDKTLNPNIEYHSSNFYRGFLRGWFDADGTVHVDKEKGNYCRLSSSILPNLRIAQRMLSKLGIISTLYENRKEAGYYDLPDGHGGYKKYYCEAMHEIHISSDNLEEFHNMVGFATPYKQKQLEEIIQNRKRLPNRERFVDEVVKIELIGEQPVYDCTVSDSHEFDANGISVHNCSEIPLCVLDSCRLLLMNLLTYVKKAFTSKAYFDWDEFYADAKIAQRIMDDIIDLEVEAIDRIINKIKKDPQVDTIKHRELDLWERIKEKCVNGRRTGTGVTAVGDTIAALGLKYGSHRSIEIVTDIYKTLKFACYESSIDMAETLGPFPIHNAGLEENNDFLNRMKDEVVDLSDRAIKGKDLLDRMSKVGRRNIALLTTAPAGSTSIECQTTSGIEPAYMLSYFRRKKGNPGDDGFRSDFVDEMGDHWMEFEVYHPTVKKWMEVTGKDNIEESPWWGCCAEDLNWKQRVKLQAAAQQHVDHAISSTINLPEDVSVEQVAEIYEAAWEAGCKGITVYRKNCRTGVLVDKKPEPQDAEFKRPKKVPCEIHHITVRNKGQYFVLVGFVDGKPYEVFAGKNGWINKKVTEGHIVRARKGLYRVELTDDTEILPQDLCSDEEEAVTRLTSTLLRTGADMNIVVTQLEKVKGEMLGFARSIARALKKYIPDGTEVAGELCDECGANLVRQEGCLSCSSCGWSKCA